MDQITTEMIGSRDEANMVNTDNSYQTMCDKLKQGKVPNGYSPVPKLTFYEESEDSSDNNTKQTSNISKSRRTSATSYDMSSAQDSEDDENSDTVTDDGESEVDVDEEDFVEVDDDICKFGKIFPKHSLKNYSFEDSCLCSCKNMIDDSVSGWSGPKKTKKIKTVKRRKSAINQVPNAYLRACNSARENDFKFCHYNDVNLYMKQYRINHSVGDVCSEYKEDDTTFPDPYDFKLKTNISTLAQHYDFLAVFALPIGAPCHKSQNLSNENEKRKVEEDDDEDDDEKLIKMSVKDRGKNLNLAPVRASTAARRSEMKVAKKTLVPFNPYLNLIIPKTTLNQADVQLNIEARRSQTPRFEPVRTVVSKAQANFKEGAYISKSAEPSRKMTSPAERANEVRLLRTTAYPPESPYSAKDPSIRNNETPFNKTKEMAVKCKDRTDSASSKKQTIVQRTPLVQTISINNFNDSVSPSLNRTPSQTEQRIEKENEIKYRFKFLDTVQKMPERIRHDTVVPLSVGAFSLRGKTCVPEETQLSSLQKIRKERQSRTAVPSFINS